MDHDYRMDFAVPLDFDVHTDLAPCRDSGRHKDLGLPFRKGLDFHKDPGFLVALDACMDPVLPPLLWESCLGHSPRFHHPLKAHPVLFRHQESRGLAGGCTLGAQCALEHTLRRKALGNLVGTCKVGTTIKQPMCNRLAAC